MVDVTVGQQHPLSFLKRVKPAVLLNSGVTIGGGGGLIHTMSPPPPHTHTKLGPCYGCLKNVDDKMTFDCAQ